MGANPTQAQAFLIFLIGFVLTTAGFAVGGNFILILLSVALLVGSTAMFLKCKPWEQKEE